MKTSLNLCNYLNSSYSFIHSNILLTNLKEILLAYTYNKNNSYKNKKLSNDILEIIDDWKDAKKFDNNFICKNDFFYKIIEEDKTLYSGQLIFPIYHNNVLDGILIFFREKGNYISSSCKVAETTRNFVEQMSDDNYW